uniref:alpha-tectorin-like n=1 Tax=Ciona intestinalis TaxID=7719 RepID=UPI000180C213|nr:alpha-tectorin-like [Ciona intestinalis]|eukprot:XP_002129961.1 alpha-tectorin-like [Ciona intestinalis]
MHPNSTRNYNLISQSCPADSYTTVTRNHNSSYTTFEFKSFIWTNVTLSSQQIYVHCEVTICDQNLNATCNTLNCAPSRRRRDASTNSYKVISAGPVLIATSIDDDTRPCEQNDYCSDVCTMMGGKPVCSCGEGLKLGEDMRTCVELSNEDSNTLVYLMGISLVLLLGIIAMKKFNA